MVCVNCDNPIIIREDRVYRYVGNGSDLELQTSGINQDNKHNLEINETHQSVTKEEVRNAYDFTAMHLNFFAFTN